MILIKKSTIKGAGKGAFAKKNFEKYELLDEYKGIFIKPKDYKNDSWYVWELYYDDGDVLGYIDSQDKDYSNWTRYVNCPNSKKQENVMAVQKNRKIFYYACKKIKEGDELFVWYGPEYGKQLTGKRVLK